VIREPYPHRRPTPKHCAHGLNQHAEIVVSTYNEPLITSEWPWQCSEKLKPQDCSPVRINGNGTPEVLEYLRPWIDLYKIDLKSFDDRQYRKLAAGCSRSGHHRLTAN